MGAPGLALKWDISQHQHLSHHHWKDTVKIPPKVQHLRLCTQLFNLSKLSLTSRLILLDCPPFSAPLTSKIIQVFFTNAFRLRGKLWSDGINLLLENLNFHWELELLLFILVTSFSYLLGVVKKTYTSFIL